MYKKVDYEERTCLECNKEFKPKRKDQVFCEKKCKTKNYWRDYYKKHQDKILEKNQAWNRKQKEKRDGNDSH